MKFIELVKLNLKPATSKSWSDHITLNKIPSGSIVLSVATDGDIYKNYDNKVTITNVHDSVTAVRGKSATKKIAGGVTGGLLAGGIGAIVGALAFGNNKVITQPTHIYIEYTEHTSEGDFVRSTQVKYDKDKFQKLLNLKNNGS